VDEQCFCYETEFLYKWNIFSLCSFVTLVAEQSQALKAIFRQIIIDIKYNENFILFLQKEINEKSK